MMPNNPRLSDDGIERSEIDCRRQPEGFARRRESTLARRLRKQAA